MKKQLLFLLALLCLVTGCAAQKLPASSPSLPETTAGPAVIMPLPVTLDPEDLDNCSVSISLQEGDAYVDDTGIMRMRVTVYTYDLYDMVDISRLEVGSILLLQQKEVHITALERAPSGNIVINGGLDVGGYELRTDDNTVFYETGYSDVKSWYPLGEAVLQVSPDFTYTDRSDPDRPPICYYPGDFLIPGTGIDYYFTPQNTTITIENGSILAMERLYTP